MGSRLRENPRRLLECWCEVVGPQGEGGRPPWISQKFPSTYTDEEVLKSVPQFTFPCPFENTTIQHFSFVLTSLDSKWTYGFCRHAPGSHTALVLLSHLPWHEIFYKLLNHLADLRGGDDPGDLTACLQSVYKAPVPTPGSEVTIPYASNKFFVGTCPDHYKLPTIPENRNLLEYYNAVDVENMVAIFASMLFERRIIITSRRVSRLSACVQAANLVLWPMQWQHIFIPVLPQHLVDYLLAPMPFLIGVASGLLTKVQMEDIGEAVILDADANTVSSPFQDTASLPQEVTATLRRNLRSAHNTIGDGVARAFLRALVQLIGNYKEALQFREDDKKITFCRERFVALRPLAMQSFAEKLLQLQIFQQFIGRDFSDSIQETNIRRLELEVNLLGERSGSKVKQQYWQFVTSVRKDGGAIIKTMKSKSPFKHLRSNEPSVTKGGKQVKEKGRQTYKEFRGRLRDLQQLREDPRTSPSWVNGEGVMQKKPRSAPTSPTITRRPRSAVGGARGFVVKTTYKRATQVNSRDDRNRKYDLIEGNSGLMSPASTDSLSTPSPQSLDLMGVYWG
ncbi:hypothetical protein O3P69_012747, partial [Scylla paramamosain]